MGDVGTCHLGLRNLNAPPCHGLSVDLAGIDEMGVLFYGTECYLHHTMTRPTRRLQTASPLRPELDLRARAREFLRGELSAAARALFAERGFENVTVEEIAAAVGVSRRTFFRYFATKEDVILQQSAALGHQMADALALRPEDEPAWDALRAMVHSVIENIDDDPAEALRRYEMLRTTPALQPARVAKQHARIALLAPLISERLLAQGAVSRARAEIAAAPLVGAALSCMETVLEVWCDSGGTRDPKTLLDTAMDLVADLTTTPGPTKEGKSDR